MINSDNPTPLNTEMAIAQMRLSDTWIKDLHFDQLSTSTSLHTGPDWPCAVSVDNRILFTQLISTDWQMRDGYYEYLLAIGFDMIVISYNGIAKVEKIGSWRQYKINDIKIIVDRCAILTTCDHKGLNWEI